MNHSNNYETLKSTINAIADQLQDGKLHYACYLLGQVELTLQLLIGQTKKEENNG